ncbi:putative peptidase M15A [Erwinia phage vB_EamM_Phobos]|uniref:putative peptidase M15A n=1 Tax=Erwinia phage vB_EamM_Phobos TaxID=1883377 RepID=UPI00081C5E98|nr:putative peptidase M15A [Erwinia phage vB_EamM_Phobos]ANZ50349.1 putative peptidase M15A [Erwinia phage vB_EamM_Phobos]
MFQPNPKQFKLEELVPPDIIARRGANAAYLISPLVMVTLQQLRNKFGPIVANSPSKGMTQRTIRTLQFFINQEKPKGGNWKERAHELYAASDSMHKYGGAMDLNFQNYSSQEVRAYIMQNPNEFPFIHFLETDISWFHFDVRNQANLTVWSPTRGTVSVIPQKPIEWNKLVSHL